MQIYMPSQDPLAHDDFACTPRKIKKWIKELPLTDLDTASEQLYQLIAKNNRASISTKQRLACIDLLQPLGRDLLNHLRKYLACQSFPLSSRADDIYNLQQNLNAEFAIAYKIVLLDVIQGNAKLDAKKILHCIFNAINYLKQQYISCVLMYQQVPQNLWHDICQLYRAAEYYEIHQTIVNSSNEKLSIENIFRHLCSLTLISFNKLRQGEAERVSKFLEQHYDLVEVRCNIDELSGDYIYVANLATGKQPTYYIPREMPISSENCLINYEELVNKLGESTKKFAQSYSYYLQSSDELDPELAGRLIDMIGSPTKRSIDRIKSKQTVKAIVGLQQVVEAASPVKESPLDAAKENSFVVNSLSLLPIEKSLAKLTPSILEASPNETLNDIWNPYATHDTYEPENNESEVSSDTANQKKEVNIDNWHVDNYSTGGFCLYYNSDRICSTRVGEIIAIRDQQDGVDSARLNVGTIRWMQGLPNQVHKVGIELFGAECASIHASNKGSNQEEWPGLLLKQIYNTRKSYSLILPAKYNLDGQEVFLRGARSTRTVMLGKTLEKTSCFIHIEIVKIFSK